MSISDKLKLYQSAAAVRSTTACIQAAGAEEPDQQIISLDLHGWFDLLVDAAPLPPNCSYAAIAWRFDEDAEVFEQASDDGLFFFCDDDDTWASPWLDSNVLTKWLVRFRNPWIIKELPEDMRFETHMLDETLLQKLHALGHDAVIYLGDGSGMVGRIRQGMILVSNVTSVPIRILNFNIMVPLVEPIIDMSKHQYPLTFAIARYLENLVPWLKNEYNAKPEISKVIGKSNMVVFEKVFEGIKQNLDLQLRHLGIDDLDGLVKVKYNPSVNMLCVKLMSHKEYGTSNIVGYPHKGENNGFKIGKVKKLV